MIDVLTAAFGLLFLLVPLCAIGMLEAHFRKQDKR